jgi:diguanylate cyclase (GGDEF)-like protein/putative nucleotidyltransferase with HDIG domain
MTLRARAFRLLLLWLGLALLCRNIYPWDNSEPGRYAAFVLLTVFSALLRVGVPTPDGTLRLSFMFLLVAIAHLPSSQAAALGAAAALVESLSPKREGWDWTDSLVRMAVMSLGVGAAQLVFQKSQALGGPGALAIGLTLASMTLFLATAFPLASVISLSEGVRLRGVWQQRFLWALPYYLAGAALAGLYPALGVLRPWESALLLVPTVYLVYRAYSMQIERLHEKERSAQELATLQAQMIEALALTMEARDHGTHDHLRRVTAYVDDIGRQFGMRGDALSSLRAAALLHDIGKLAVPEHILSKPARLTPEEFEKMKVHPLVGAQILEESRFPAEVCNMVRAHHERWDGSGYPHGLKGNAIPLGARILAAVDCLDALASDRHYRRAIPLAQAVEQLRVQAGTSFDPDVVRVIERRYREVEEKMRAEARETTTWSVAKPGNKAGPAAGYLPSLETPAPDFLTAITAARREEQLWNDLTQTIGASLNLGETMTSLSRRVIRLIPHETLVLYALRDGQLEAQEVVGEHYSLFQALKIPLGQGVSGWVAEKRKPLVNANPSVEPAPKEAAGRLQQFRSALAVPLETASGVVGALTFYAQAPDAFTREHLRILLTVAPRLATTVEHSLQFAQAEEMAAFDFLTGLPNAGSLFTHLQNEIARCHRNSEPLAVLLCDLNGFKQINDRFGHLTGNKVLQRVAQELKNHCRDYDFVARLGGDEFVIVLPGLTAETVRHRRQRFNQLAVGVGREVCGEELMALSIGEAHCPVDGVTAEDLLARADERMYQEKHEFKTGRRRWGSPTAHDWYPRVAGET